MALTVKARIDLSHPRMRELLYGPTGPVVTFVRSTTRKVRTRAVLTCPVDTGNLRAAHREEVSVRRGKVFGFVANDVDYAGHVHDGTRPHRVRARRPGGLLRFHAGGEVVFTRSVQHPGTKPRPWLRQALEDVALPLGFRITQ